MKNKVLYAIVSLLVLTGCGSMKNMSREDRAGVGAQIGAFVGWLFGGAVGNSIDDDIAANTGDEIRVEKRNSGNYTPSSHVLLPDLQIEDILLEEDSVTRDDKINAGETCRISLVIVNNSFQDALDVEPIVKVEKGRYLKLSEPVKIAKITRDDRIIYNVMVQASPKLRTGEAVFSVRLKEGRGNGTEEETFTVKTVGGDK